MFFFKSKKQIIENDYEIIDIKDILVDDELLIDNDIQDNIENDVKDNIENDIQDNIENDIQDNIENDVKDINDEESLNKLFLYKDEIFYLLSIKHYNKQIYDKNFNDFINPTIDYHYKNNNYDDLPALLYYLFKIKFD